MCNSIINFIEIKSGMVVARTMGEEVVESSLNGCSISVLHN